MIGVVGATGLVGLEIRKIFAESKDPYESQVKYFASFARPEEGILDLAQSHKELAECEFLLNAATNETAQQLRDQMRDGQTMIDNSSAFRLDPDVPLVVPEVNGAQLEAFHSIIANPNCTTIILCMALRALHDFGLARVVVSTYQAASGAGIKGLEELDRQIAAVGKGEKLPPPEVFPFPLAMNILSHNTPIRGDGRLGAGYNEEECKVMEETRKILSISHLPVSATCMRVPVRRAHTEAVTVDLKQEAKLGDIRAAFASMKGLKIVDDPEKNHFPMPFDAENVDDILIGRIRKDSTLPKTIHFTLAGDQIRKGAALNAIQIMRRIREIQARG